MKYSVWSKTYSSEFKEAEFDASEDAMTFADLLYKGRGGKSHIWVCGVIKDYPNADE